jgi:hypothetical protein
LDISGPADTGWYSGSLSVLWQRTCSQQVRQGLQQSGWDCSQQQTAQHGVQQRAFLRPSADAESAISRHTTNNTANDITMRRMIVSPRQGIGKSRQSSRAETAALRPALVAHFIRNDVSCNQAMVERTSDTCLGGLWTGFAGKSG